MGGCTEEVWHVPLGGGGGSAVTSNEPPPLGYPVM